MSPSIISDSFTQFLKLDILFKQIYCISNFKIFTISLGKKYQTFDPLNWYIITVDLIEID